MVRLTSEGGDAQQGTYALEPRGRLWMGKWRERREMRVRLVRLSKAVIRAGERHPARRKSLTVWACGCTAFCIAPKLGLPSRYRTSFSPTQILLVRTFPRCVNSRDRFVHVASWCEWHTAPFPPYTTCDSANPFQFFILNSNYRIVYCPRGVRSHMA